MGYTTEFEGEFLIEPPLSTKLTKYINRFSNVRHMKRNIEKTKELYPNWRDFCFRCRLGYEGEYFAIESDDYGQEYTSDIIDYNEPPETQPGLWCDWFVPEDDPSVLRWDGSEKFYDYKEWLEYLIKNFLEPNGHVVNGTVRFEGENPDDKGYLYVNDNKVEMVYDDESLTFD